MKILKRNGRTEDFDIHKIRTSIENSANDIGFVLTEGDLNMLAHEIERVLFSIRKTSLLTSSYEVRGIAFHVLIDSGFTSVVRSYMNMPA